MNLLAPSPGQGNWRERLLDAPIDPAWAQTLPQFLGDVGRQFLSQTAAHLTPKEIEEADTWYYSVEGQEILQQFALQAWDQMGAYARYAMPAHDFRHAAVKVPAAALEYVLAENVAGHARVGVLGALLHDYGRWAEERLFGRPRPGLVHARLSFLLTAELLSGYEMPSPIKNQILIAVLRHTSGAVPEDPMPLKLTAAADRDQLYGPEIVLRLLHHVTQPDGELTDIYSERSNNAILDRLEHFTRNRLPGPLFSMPKHVAWLRHSLRTFILMAEDADRSRRRFSVDLGGEGSKKPIGLDEMGVLFNWEAEWELAHARRLAATDPKRELRVLLSAPGVAPGEQFLQEALGRIERVPHSLAPYLAGAIAWGREAMRWNDQRQRIALSEVFVKAPGDFLLTTLATKCLSKLR